MGASAGINLLCDRFRLDYGAAGATGPSESTVRIDCEVTGGDPPIADQLPELVHRVGIDRSPIDLSDPTDARWLLACVWPDTGRAERVQASIRLAQRDLPQVVAGRADAVLPGVLARLPDGATAIVMTTWAFGYFSVDERAEFVELLRDASARRPVAWISAENGGTVDALTAVGAGDSSGPDVLGAMVMVDGVESVQHLASVHAHGNWIDWRAPA